MRYKFIKNTEVIYNTIGSDPIKSLLLYIKTKLNVTTLSTYRNHLSLCWKVDIMKTKLVRELFK